MDWTYDPQNIFARILRGEIPNRTVAESEHTLVFEDIHPHAPVHLLAIPKGAYVSFDHFSAKASEDEIVDFHRTLARVIAGLNLSNPDGYRAITNTGAAGMQEVAHYHLHILGGRILGRLVDPG